jgi:uncharacterized damage-inducible protein DinB
VEAAREVDVAGAARGAHRAPVHLGRRDARDEALDLDDPAVQAMQATPFTTTAALLDGVRPAGRSSGRARAATDGELLVPWTLKKSGGSMFTMPRVSVLRSMVLNHSVHHRGQLSVYLRILDVPLPAIYGPTADEQ